MTGWERIEQLMALGHSRTVALRIVKKENQATKARKKEEEPSGRFFEDRV